MTLKSTIRRKRYAHGASMAAVALASLAGTQSAFGQESAPVPAAQEEAPTTGLQDIVVTARKRAETSLNAPVAITAVGSEELERRQITSLDNLAVIVPQLVIGEPGGGFQGGTIALRGIGTGESGLTDQAISFNIDGVAIAKATARRLSDFDTAQIEVLRGPQALFFGKNSPGGIISLRSADPGDRFAAGLSAGYEFEAATKQVQGFVSGPLGSGFGARLAFFGEKTEGWVTDVTPRTNPYAPAYPRLPRGEEYGGRLTLTYAGGDFDMRAKLTYARRKGAGPGANVQLVACPVGGVAQSGATNNDCTADDRTARIDLGTAFLTSSNPTVAYIGGLIGGSVPYLDNQQLLASVEANYDVTPELQLTSVTGYYDIYQTNAENFGYTNVTANALMNYGLFDHHEFSEELRLSSDFKGPINFAVGGLYTYMSTRLFTTTLRNVVTPAAFNLNDLPQKGKAWSIFGQLRWDIMPDVELSGGGRYSHETKRMETVRGLIGGVIVSGRSSFEPVWTNFSPEATLTWRPNPRLTVFGSYKQGFLSGGYASSTTSVTAVPTYDQQRIEGVEAGVKALLLDNNLRTNLTYYNYITTGLAITTSINGTPVATNAGRVHLRGLEFDFNLAVPGVDGLIVRGSAAWEKARYVNYTITCWAGQTPAQGCNRSMNAAGTAFTLQDLAGTQLLRAPDWSGTLGVSYETELSSALKASFSADGNYSDSYFTEAQSIPYARQKAFAKIDLNATIGDRDDRWQLSFIARNLTDQYTFVRGVVNPFSGSGTGTAAGIPGDIAGSVSRGREFWLRASFKFGQ